ncbi:thioredoxin domain-containing protein [Solemya elarraichensis gill symbiont]|uniref:Spermatogenesis-associated protein 20-like TRX domain-containing protein n=1 Tax=Solemya elarraichensis gill symbiont TaxID=1918949 RepID=A0A1T2LBM1_9GAMM|nr:DUF255 domain-containing protein [Solemya elarraichensis gill symbiont]OOZ42503.1 hypothetical protein BOW52_02860 [Solemya elarraichensis gill symbiont]
MKYKIVIYITATLLLFSSALQANQLKNHASPYLALHGNDPVDWHPWGQQALEAARKGNNPLFISSGYFSCHWCHVMHRESYVSDEVAKLLNSSFIPVKIDRELEPALDSYLINFVERTRGAGGWPLHVIMTPEGYPLTGFTYAPREQLMTALKRIDARWQQESLQLKKLAHEAYQQMYLGSEEQQTRDVTVKSIESRFIHDAIALANELQGGFGQQNQFPMAPQLTALLTINAARQDSHLAEFLELTLDQMAQQGLRDHLVGGFFRYTIDPAWQTPHYEKMLYTQAQMVRLYLLAAKRLQRPDYIQIATETADFVLKHMRGRSGGFISSLSAVDQHEVEGGSYLWSAESLSTLLLNEDEKKFAELRWGLETAGGDEQLPTERLTLEAVASKLEMTDDAASRLQERVRQRLLGERRRNSPPEDNKQLTAWNGLMLSAFSELGLLTGERRYSTASVSLARWLLRAWDGDKLSRSLDGSTTVGSAALADYAYVAEGLKKAWKLSNINAFSEKSDKIIKVAWSRYFDSAGWHASDAMLIPAPGGAGALQGAPMPSPAAVLISLGGNAESLQQAYSRQVTAIADEPFWYPGHLLQARQFATEAKP